MDLSHNNTYLSFVLKEKLKSHPQNAIMLVASHEVMLWASYMGYHLQDYEVYPFLGSDVTPYAKASPSPQVISTRLHTLQKLSKNASHPRLVISDIFGLMGRLIPKDALIYDNMKIEKGRILHMNALKSFLEDMGYRAVSTAYEMGEYSIRGNLVDVFLPGMKQGVRLDLFGNTIESIKMFDPFSQRSLEKIKAFELAPAREIILSPQVIATIKRNKEFLPNDMYERLIQGIYVQGMEFYLPLFYESTQTLHDYTTSSSKDSGLKTFATKEVNEQISLIWQDIERSYQTRLRLKERVLDPYDLYTPIPTPYVLGKEELLARPFALFSVTTPDHKDHFLKHLIEQGNTNPVIEIAPFEEGFETSLHKMVTFYDVYGKEETSDDVCIQFFDENHVFTQNDYYIHEDHGVGRYIGLETLPVNHTLHDFIAMEYDGNDRLWVPVESMNLLSFFSSHTSQIALDKLGSSKFQSKKARIKKQLELVAHGLIELAAKRQHAKGTSLLKSDDFEAFCKLFPHPLTPDQKRATDAILHDMAGTKPMDRLLCADVGFGKTEVAMRAAFVALGAGKQVVLLCPTTLLCRQHFTNFTKRFESFPYVIKQASRLVSTKDLKILFEQIKAQHVDMVIATHSILNDDVTFKDLGLIIIDEEHHFGVRQKERLKALQENVHVLTLSATPIPRTLQMGLSGIRDLSLMSTPPKKRQAVKTFVSPYDEALILDAITREHARGGQVFFVTRFVQDLDALVTELQMLVPHVRILCAHGRMNAKELASTMEDFYEHKCDVLVSTNIIESGIDIERANTIIIHKAQEFGLSQLYQLRGRVGRSAQIGYAYLLVTKDPTPMGEKRLHVMETLDFLGASFQLASYDLDIRGAGNLIGEEQSGHVKEVGLELYQHLLKEALDEQKMLGLSGDDNKNASVPHLIEPKLNLGVDLYIPKSYIDDISIRLSLYKRLSRFKTPKQIDAFGVELIDRFGKMPLEVLNLLEMMSIKAYCYKHNIIKIDATCDVISVQFKEMHPSQFKNLLDHPTTKKIGTLSFSKDNKLIVKGDFEKSSLRLKIIKFILIHL